MQTKTLLFSACLLVITTSVANGTYITPPLPVVEDYQPSQFEFPDTFGKARTALANSGYDAPIRRSQTTASNSPAVNFLTFTNDFSNDYGVWLHSSHGGLDGSLVEWITVAAYGSTTQAQTAALNAQNSYISQGLIDAADIKVVPGPNSPYYWQLAISEDGIALYRNDNMSSEALAFIVACDSYYGREAWGAKAFAGYNYSCPDHTAHPETDSFWDTMGGSRGMTHRTFDDADDGTTIWIDPVGSPMVLTPAISSWTYGDDLNPATITMDAPVDIYNFNLFPDNILTASGAVDIFTSSWRSDHELEFNPNCMFDGPGSVTLATNSVITTGGIKLNPDGVGVRTEPFKIGYNCQGGINPAAFVENIVVMPVSGVNTVRWSTTSERNTASFSVQRIASNGAITEFPVTAHGPGPYEVLDPGGTLQDQYKLVEHQTGGRPDLIFGQHSVLPPFTPFNTDPVYDMDAIQSAIATIPAYNDPGTETPAPNPPPMTVAVFCPDSMQSSAQALVNLYGSRSISAGVIPMSYVASHGGIKACLLSFHNSTARTEYGDLVGIASDSIPRSQPWPVGFSKETGYPLQYAPNMMPTNYTWVAADSSHRSMTRFTPYFASDALYGDLDNDGLPDIPVARIPAKNNAEMLAYVVKLSSFYSTPASTPWTKRASLFSYAVDFGDVPGPVVAAHAESLALHIPPPYQTSKMINRNGPTWTTLQCDSIAKNHINNGRGLLVFDHANSNMYYAGFFGKQWGWSPAAWTANHAYPIVLAMSCDLGDIDRTRNANYGDPLVQTAMMLPDKGPVAWVGASRATWEAGNVIIGTKILDNLYKFHMKDIGTAVLAMQRTIIALHPEYKELALSIQVLGDPLVAPIGFSTITGVDDAPFVPRNRMDPAHPNPFNPSTALTLQLAASAHVRLAVYDVAGRLVRTLANRKLPAGPTMLTWNGTTDSGQPAASGVYFARVTGPFDQTQKVVLMK